MALFQMSAHWVQWKGKRSDAPLPVRLFLYDLASERLRKALALVSRKHVNMFKSSLSQGFRVFEVDLKETAGRNETVRKATNELRRATEAAPPRLRPLIAPIEFDWAVTILKLTLDVEIPLLLKIRRSELKEEYDTNCSRASNATVKEGAAALSFFTRWTSDLEAEWMSRFLKAVPYNEFPRAMQSEVKPMSKDWARLTLKRIHNHLFWKRVDWVIVSLVVGALTIIIIVAVHHRTKRFRNSRRTKLPFQYFGIIFMEPQRVQIHSHDEKLCVDPPRTPLKFEAKAIKEILWESGKMVEKTNRRPDKLGKNLNGRSHGGACQPLSFNFEAITIEVRHGRHLEMRNRGLFCSSDIKIGTLRIHHFGASSLLSEQLHALSERLNIPLCIRTSRPKRVPGRHSASTCSAISS
jgi:hypothetical protein